jgi:hypothetical protein
MIFVTTATGREHHLAGIHQQLNTPCIEEIAHALAQINRFTGHARRPYSVAEHSLLVAAIAASEGATPIAQLAALLHDAHEAYAGDVASPIKWALGNAWTVFEAEVEHQVHRAFGVIGAMHSHRADIKRWDLMALAIERRDLINWDPATSRPWPVLDTPGHEVLPLPLMRLTNNWRARRSWARWAEVFLGKYRGIKKAMQAQGITQ